MKLTSQKILLMGGAGILLALGSAAVAQKSDDATHPNGKAKSVDMQFARRAATGGMEEVELGKLAVQKASNNMVKQFGQRMVDDHSKANDQLKALAAQDNFSLPTELTAKEKTLVDKLSALSGTEFDRAYMRNMVKDHEQDIAHFQKESSSGTNNDLKMWATSVLPTLRDHLKMAEDTDNSLNSTSSK